MNQNVIQLFPYLNDSEIEDLLLASLFQEAEPVVVDKSPFSLNYMPNGNCLLNFRFHKSDLWKLKALLEIPDKIVIGTTRTTGMEALCVLLRRLAYPSRYFDLMKIFGRSRSELCKIFRMIVKLVLGKWGHLLQGLKHPVVDQAKMIEFAAAIEAKGSPYKHCVGFIDGTVRAICRPTKNQRSYYNGHKRTHALKFQSVMLPDGIIGSMYGPIQGRRHDAFILDRSKIVDVMEARFVNGQGTNYYLYGDPAYPLLKCLMVPFKGHNLTPAKQACNSRMSKVRECVEWGFGKVISIFAFLDYKKNLKLELQPVSDFYKVAVILANCHTCLYGSQTADYFDLAPPKIEQYLVKY